MKPNALLGVKTALLAIALLRAAAPVGAQEKFVYPSYPKPGEPKRADADNTRRIVPAPDRNYWPFSGLSGPGAPVTEETSRGGWASDLINGKYKGPVPRSYPTAPWSDDDSGSAVTQGLMPALRPIWDVHLRDTVICLGGDGNYYMTGTTGDNCWALNDGIELYVSDDLKTWRYLGLVWSIERDGTWEKNWTMREGVPFRTIWAPEIHFISGNYYIVTCISGVGMGVLKSTSGKAEGPYVHVIQDTPIKGGIDSTLFEDDDGRIYVTYGDAAQIREIERDFSGFAGDWQRIEYDMPPLPPSTERPGPTGGPRVGFEGATLFKVNGRYYLGCCDFVEGRYSFRFATSDKLLGPYRERHEGPAGGGGGNIFRDKNGQWWQTYFGNDKQMPFREKPGLAAITFDASGKVVFAKNQPFAASAAKGAGGGSALDEAPAAAEADDKSAVQSAVAALVIVNADAAYGNLTLPTSMNGTHITWSSADEKLVTATGEVTRPRGADASVVLRAKITKGTASALKDFTVRVVQAFAKAANQAYLFVHFTFTEEKIHFSLSKGNNALDWRELNNGKPVFTSTIGTLGLRDPHIVRSPEGDTFYLMATDLKWFKGGEKGPDRKRYIQVWESHDLVNWSAQRDVLVAPAHVQNTYAPEAVWDDSIGAYVVFWTSKLGSNDYHTPMYATTRDFVTFTEAQVWQPNEWRIDSTVMKVGEWYYRFTKSIDKAHDNAHDIVEERSKNLRVLRDQWETVDYKIGAKAGVPETEAPLVFKSNPGDVHGDWFYLWIEKWIPSKTYVALRTKSLEHPKWEEVPANFPDPLPKHGTILPITAAEAAALAASYPTVKPAEPRP